MGLALARKRGQTWPPGGHGPPQNRENLEKRPMQPKERNWGPGCLARQQELEAEISCVLAASLLIAQTACKPARSCLTSNSSGKIADRRGVVNLPTHLGEGSAGLAV